jgi:hypothetical protein
LVSSGLGGDLVPKSSISGRKHKSSQALLAQPRPPLPANLVVPSCCTRCPGIPGLGYIAHGEGREPKQRSPQWDDPKNESEQGYSGLALKRLDPNCGSIFGLSFLRCGFSCCCWGHAALQKTKVEPTGIVQSRKSQIGW